MYAPAGTAFTISMKQWIGADARTAARERDARTVQQHGGVALALYSSKEGGADTALAP